MSTAAEDLLEWVSDYGPFSLVEWEELNGLIGAVMSEARSEKVCDVCNVRRATTNERQHSDVDQVLDGLGEERQDT